MTYSLIGLGLSCFALGLVISYCMWVSVRDIFLRQDLFEIRDRMWDAMRAAGTLDEPAHRAVRLKINTFIRAGHTVSLPSILAITSSRHAEQRPTCNDPAIEEMIAAAERDASKRMWRFVSRDRFGSFIAGLLYAGGVRAAKRIVSLWGESDGPRHLAELADREACRTAARA